MSSSKRKANNDSDEDIPLSQLFPKKTDVVILPEHRRKYNLKPSILKKLFDSYYYWTLAAMQYIVDNEETILNDF